MTVQADQFRSGENQVSGLVHNAGGGHAEDVALVRSNRPPGDAQLLALLAGVNDYSDHRKNASGTRVFGDLTSAGRRDRARQAARNVRRAAVALQERDTGRAARRRRITPETNRRTR